jgi:hypothetical protein
MQNVKESRGAFPDSLQPERTTIREDNSDAVDRLAKSSGLFEAYVADSHIRHDSLPEAVVQDHGIC